MQALMAVALGALFVVGSIVLVALITAIPFMLIWNWAAPDTLGYWIRLGMFPAQVGLWLALKYTLILSTLGNFIGKSQSSSNKSE